MKAILTAFKRALRDIPFVIAVIGAAVVIALSPAMGGSSVYPPAGIYDGDGGEDAAKLMDAMLDAGYTACQSREELAKMVSEGELDCGIIIKDGFSQCIRRGGDKALEFIYTDASCTPELTRITAAAYVFRLSAPYTAAEQFTDGALEDENIEYESAAAVTDGGSETQMNELQEQTVIEYEKYFEDGLCFSFEVSTGRAKEPENARAMSLTQGSTAILLFALVMYTNLRDLRSASFPFCRMLGARRALLDVTLPISAARLVIIIIAAMGALFAAGEEYWELMLPAAAYCAVIYALSLILAAILPGESTAKIVLPVIILAGMALCPIYTDLSLTIPILGIVKPAVPPVWLWYCIDSVWFKIIAFLSPLPAAAILYGVRNWETKHGAAIIN